MQALTTVERAFQLARSGKVTSVENIISLLRAENHMNAIEHLQGPQIRSQLKALMKTESETKPVLAP